MNWILENKKKRVKKLLVNYFQQSFEKSGLQWDNDNTVEVEEIIDLILDIAGSNAKKDIFYLSE
jgi:hypothetical protein